MNFKNTAYYIATTKQTVPLNSIQTGTIETVGKAVKGTGTLFTTELPVGSWVVDLAQDEIRRVESVESDTLAYMSNAFTVDLAAATPLDAIPAKDAKCVTIGVAIAPGGAAGEVDGSVFPAGVPLVFSKDSRDHSAARDLVDPIIIDGASVLVSIQK